MRFRIPGYKMTNDDYLGIGILLGMVSMEIIMLVLFITLHEVTC